MSVTNEAPVIDKWVAQRLKASPALVSAVDGRIRADMSQPGEPFPIVIFSALSAGVDVLARTTRVMTTAVYLVKVVGQTGSYVPLQPIADLIDQALHEQESTLDGYRITCWREGIVRYGEAVDGVQFRHLGGRYRVQAHRL